MSNLVKCFRILPAIICALGIGRGTSSAQVKIETGFLDRFITLGGVQYHYQVYVPSVYTPVHSWPVILFLHGAGERGRDGLLQTQVGLGAAIRANASRYPALVVFPQSPSDSLWVGVPARMAMAALGKTMEEFRVDSDRVYLTGLSMGGNGTWYLAYRNPSMFAAIVPVCGWVTPFNPWMARGESVVSGDSAAPFSFLARRLSSVPIWIFHGEEDPAVPVDQSRQAAAALTAVGGRVHFTELPGTGHNSWDAAYGSSAFVRWLFQQQRRR